MREIDPPPKGVAGYKLPEKPGQRFKYRYILRSEKKVAELIEQLNAAQMMFNTRVEDRKSWFARTVNPEGKSVTWSLLSYAFVMFAVASVIAIGVMIWSNPELRQNILDAIEVFKG